MGRSCVFDHHEVSFPSKYNHIMNTSIPSSRFVLNILINNNTFIVEYLLLKLLYKFLLFEYSDGGIFHKKVHL